MYIARLARLTAAGSSPAWQAPVVALLLTAAAALLRAVLSPLGAVVPFATFYVSTMLAALFGGAWAGALAGAVATVIAWYFFMEPVGTFELHGAVLANLVLFVVTQAIFVALAAILRAAIARAARAEAALQAKVGELEALMDLAPVGIWFARGPEVREITRNRHAAEMLRVARDSTAPLAGSSPGLVTLGHVTLYQDGARVPAERMPLQSGLRGEEHRNEEYEAVFADGSTITMLSNSSPIRDASGRVVAAVSASLDITAQKRTEAALRDAVAQMELLQREADHRIKNSLQLVASILRVQRGRVKDETAAALLEEAMARITAVAQAHAALQRSPDLGAADMGRMIAELCGFVGRLDPAIPVVCEREGDTFLDVARAIPLGLVVTELLTNAVRHAYPAGQGGTVRVRVVRAADGWLEVEVRDHGVGMEEAAGAKGSLGRELVRSLAQRIGAELATRTAPGQGTAVVLRIPPEAEPSGGAPEPAEASRVA
ncbi:sensor histidine kinase [Falsiroseomonas sp. HW251]|uniref:sensor histidine kinase n=1 Tax=Falsiroseomonas sp. HW251 TaxID=3390998 RepID=UPI003D31DCF5